jgi:hypothetical protein
MTLEVLFWYQLEPACFEKQAEPHHRDERYLCAMIFFDHCADSYTEQKVVLDTKHTGAQLKVPASPF